MLIQISIVRILVNTGLITKDMKMFNQGNFELYGSALSCAYVLLHVFRPLQYNSLFLITTVVPPGCGRVVNIIIHYLYISTDNLKAKRQTRG